MILPHQLMVLGVIGVHGELVMPHVEQETKDALDHAPIPPSNLVGTLVQIQCMSFKLVLPGPIALVRF